jgi:hypothetical protein
MKMADYIAKRGWTQKDLADRLGVSKALVGRWDDIPEKFWDKLKVDVPGRAWWVEGDRLHFRGSSYGHGSQWDGEYSAAKIDHIRSVLKQVGSVQGAIDWVHPVTFPSGFIQDVQKDMVCPKVVDMVVNERGNEIPVVVVPTW